MKFLDEKFIRLKCMDETNSKKVMLDENHMYMDDNYKKMKYLDEHESQMNFWMIIGSRRIVWMKLLAN